MNRTKANLMKSGFVVSVVGVVVLHQTQVVSSQINHLALAVLFGLVGYLIVFKKVLLFVLSDCGAFRSV